MDKKSYRLADATIAQIVQLIQMGILTGTDVTDQIRTLRVIALDDGTVVPDPEFVLIFNENLSKLEELADNEEQQG